MIDRARATIHRSRSTRARRRDGKDRLCSARRSRASSGIAERDNGGQLRRALRLAGPLALVLTDSGEAPSGETTTAIERAFTIADHRSFDQDPRFGLSVLAEIASRALSPAINDPGTAIDVIGRAARLLLEYARTPQETEEAVFPRLRLAPLSASDLLADAFSPIARDGAANIEVQIRLQKALAALARAPNGDLRAAAVVEARFAMDHAEAALALDSDRQKLRGFHAAASAL